MRFLSHTYTYRDRQTDRQIDRQTDRQTDRQAVLEKKPYFTLF